MAAATARDPADQGLPSLGKRYGKNDPRPARRTALFVGAVVLLATLLAIVALLRRGVPGPDASPRDGLGAQENEGGVPVPDATLAAAKNGDEGPAEAAPAETAASDPVEPIDPTVVARHDQRQNAFNYIYQAKLWGGDGAAESFSGPGSSLEYTVKTRRFMGLVFQMFNVTTFLDSPCGDCFWQPHIPGFEKISYTGVDIVEHVIEQDRAKYSSRPNMKFFHADLCQDTLPQGPQPYDAALCRDAIQHLPLASGLAAYRNIESTGARMLFTNFHSEVVRHTDIAAGDFRMTSPMLPPFNFPMPLMYIHEGFDGGVGEESHLPNQKMLALWRLPAVGRGAGQNTLYPINKEALEGKIIVVDPSMIPLLKQAGVTDFACHNADDCQ